jgi:aromatic ring-opening dioxygenase LigB subunit
MAKYPKLLMEHFQNPRNVGEISDPDGVGTVGNASCGDIMQIFSLSEDMIYRAGECGLRSIAAFAGLASKFKNSIRMLSYEGPFGVGYMVADMTALED